MLYGFQAEVADTPLPAMAASLTPSRVAWAVGLGKAWAGPQGQLSLVTRRNPENRTLTLGALGGCSGTGQGGEVSMGTGGRWTPTQEMETQRPP